MSVWHLCSSYGVVSIFCCKNYLVVAMILVSVEICVSSLRPLPVGGGSQTCIAITQVESTLLKSHVCKSVSVTSALMPFNTFDVVKHVRAGCVCTCAGETSLPEAPRGREECPWRGGTAGLSACSAAWRSKTHA